MSAGRMHAAPTACRNVKDTKFPFRRFVGQGLDPAVEPSAEYAPAGAMRNIPIVRRGGLQAARGTFS